VLNEVRYESSFVLGYGIRVVYMRAGACHLRNHCSSLYLDDNPSNTLDKGDTMAEIKWERCEYDVADQFRMRTVLTLGEWSQWIDVPEDLKGERLYPLDARLVQHRRAV